MIPYIDDIRYQESNMLAFQTLKRPRDDDSDSDEERYIAKSRPWAFQGFHHGRASLSTPSNIAIRASPPQMVPNLETPTTPSEHSEANSPVSFHDDVQLSSPRNHHNSLDVDMDMDEDDLEMVASPSHDASFVPFLRPAKLNSDLFARPLDSPVNNTGRMPTPIYPNFHTGGMGGLGYPSSGMAGGISMSNRYLGVPANPMSIQQRTPTPRKQAQPEQDRSRRMPSPISEDEDIPDTPTALTQSQLSRLSVTSEHVDTEGSRGGQVDMPPPPGVVTTPTRGRKRSGAFTGKGRFSMGYRDDCEKCRQRVPGHYSHFLS